jgi:hypothetical protein
MCRYVLLACTLLLIMACHSQRELKQPQVDKESLGQEYPALAELIRQEIRNRGGNPDAQQVHWVFGFSTGHFAADPTAAEAARYLANKLVEELAKAGDSVSAYAWEMDVWDHLPGRPRTVSIQAKTPQFAKSVSELWPRTPRQDTTGGHDTEKAIVEITRELSGAQNAVIILITPTAASVAAANTKVLGQNDPDYQDVLSRWDRVQGPAAPSGAFKQIQYRVIKPSKEIVNRTMDVIIVIPKQFAGTPSVGTPTPKVSPPVSPSHPQTRYRSIPIAIFIFIIIAIIFTITVILIRPYFGRLLLQINDRNFSLNKSGGVVITGTNQVPPREGWQIFVVSGKNVPARELATIQREGRRVVLRARDCNIRIGGIIYDEYSLNPENPVQLELYGSEEAQPGLPPQEWEILLTVEVQRER